MVRVVFYTPGFLALLLLKTGEPAGFGITVELLMLASAAAIVAGLYIGTQSSDAGADHASRIGLWSGSLVLELLAVVATLPCMVYQLASFDTLHFVVPKTVNWVINFGILVLIICGYVANRQGAFGAEKKRRPPGSWSSPWRSPCSTACSS